MTPRAEGPGLGKVARTWWPLAASWVLMALELPLVSAVMARLASPKIHLAAWGGIVFPVALIVEAPVIMLLAASTALSRDYAMYRRLRAYMMWMGGGLTVLHVLLAFTPLYDALVVAMLHPPPEIVEAGRIGLRWMTPWTWSIAYRRFNQGVLIRFGRPEAVGVGTLVRLGADSATLGCGLLLGSLPGVMVAGAAVSAGVVCEAAYSAFRLRPILRREMPAAGEPIALNAFVQFYAPLAVTSLLMMLTLPLGSAAASRLPLPLESLATWPSLAGIVFIFRSMGMAYNEVVVALLEETGTYLSLRRFTAILAVAVSAPLALIGATPLSRLWFGEVAGLPDGLADLGRAALWASLPLPGLTVLQSWFQGALVHARRTRAVTEAIALNLAVLLLLFPLAIAGWGSSPRPGSASGLTFVWGGFAVANLVQTAWLWWRSRGVMARARWRGDKPAVAVAAVSGLGG